MAYDSVTPTGFSNLLSKIVDFCSEEMGWSASFDDGVATITPKSGEAEFILSHEVDKDDYIKETTYRIVCEATKNGETVKTYCDGMVGVSNAWFFSGESPEPWFHVVIRVTENQYQHLYFGYLERYGEWECGAVVTSNHWDEYDLKDRELYYDGGNSMLFSAGAYIDPSYSPGIGGVLTEGDKPSKPKVLFGIYEDPASADDYDDGFEENNAGVVFGGYTDPLNVELIKPGMPMHSGESVLVPILLMADFDLNGYPVPLGAPSGIRFVSLDGLNPEEVVSFGDKEFQVFPLSDKYRSFDYKDWPEYEGGHSSDESARTRFGASGDFGVALLRS